MHVDPVHVWDAISSFLFFLQVTEDLRNLFKQLSGNYKHIMQVIFRENVNTQNAIQR